MSYKIAQLTVNPQQKSSVLSRIFVSQPSAEEEMLIGRLFVLLELDTEKAEDEKIADFLIADAYQQYYENEALILRDRLANLKPDIIFEAAIAKINRNLSAWLEQSKLHLKPGSLNAIIGIIHNNKLFFAQTGVGKAILFYRPKNKRGELLLDYSLVDITEKTNDPTQEIVQPNKFFTNVVAGAVPAHGYFFFANESLFEYLTKKQVTDIITTLPPAGAAEQMKNLLEQTRAFVPFFGLIVKNTAGEHDAFAAPAASVSVPGQTPVGYGRSSVNQLNLTQEKTEQILSPSGMVNFKKWMNKLKPVGSGMKNYTSSTARQISITREKLNLGQHGAAIMRTTVALTGAVVSLSVSAIKQTGKVITDPETRQKLSNNSRLAAQHTARAAFSAVDNFRRLSLRYKILVIVIGVSILGLLGNIVYSTINESRKKSAEQIALVNSNFSQKENQLEAALLYNNRDGAKEIITQMADLVNSLPSKTDKEQVIKDDFQKRYEDKLDKLYNITRLAESSFLLELPNTAKYLVADNGTIFAISEEVKDIFKINADSKTVETKNNETIPSPMLGAVIDDPIQYYIGQSNVVSYKSDSGQLASFSIENPSAQIETAAVYNNRLYVISAGAISRYTLDRKTNAFTQGQSWIKDNSSLGAVQSMAIDGRIYLIENNTVSKFSSGKKEVLSLDEISPKLEEPKAVYVSFDNDYLYVLEPKNKRLLVFTKNGKYLAQYSGDMLDNLTGAAVDQKNKFVYLMNGKKIYRIEAKHFDSK
ncbi:MAG: hypothetical protein NTY12_03300 [Candidatus Falkowbacteria bacterium]|nr:hypothetical protein [Candidatus Falkowbacteria bacterium]